MYPRPLQSLKVRLGVVAEVLSYLDKMVRQRAGHYIVALTFLGLAQPQGLPLDQTLQLHSNGVASLR